MIGMINKVKLSGLEFFYQSTGNHRCNIIEMNVQNNTLILGANISNFDYGIEKIIGQEFRYISEKISLNLARAFSSARRVISRSGLITMHSPQLFHQPGMTTDNKSFRNNMQTVFFELWLS